MLEKSVHKNERDNIMSKESKLMKNTAIIAVGNIFTKCVSFFMLPLYTSLLSTEEYGTVDLIGVIVSLLVIVMTCQMELGVFRFLIDARNDKIKQKRYVSITVIFVFCINFLFFVVLWPILNILHYKYTYYLLINVIFGVANTLLLNMARGVGNNLVYAAGSCINGTLNVLLNVLFIAILHISVEGMLLATILSLAISTIYVILKIKIWKYIDVNLVRKEEFVELIKYSFPLIPYTLCWWVINASDRVIIKWAMGASANGIYSIVYKFSSLYTMATNIFQTAWMESASENVNDEARDVFYQSIFEKTVKFYSSCSIGIIAVLPLLFEILVKKDFAAAYLYIPILLIAAFFQSVSSFYGCLYFAFKETKKVALTNVISAGLNIIMNVALINFIGLYAAAISTLLAYLIVVVIRHFDVQKLVGIHLSKSYLFCEGLVYLVILICYYSRIKFVQICALAMLIPYCIYQNREVICGILGKMYSEIKRSK